MPNGTPCHTKDQLQTVPNKWNFWLCSELHAHFPLARESPVMLISPLLGIHPRAGSACLVQPPSRNPAADCSRTSSFSLVGVGPSDCWYCLSILSHWSAGHACKPNLVDWNQGVHLIVVWRSPGLGLAAHIFLNWFLEGLHWIRSHTRSPLMPLCLKLSPRVPWWCRPSFCLLFFKTTFAVGDLT